MQGQDAPHISDVLMPDAPAVHDIATPRRTVGGRCRKWCISAQPASGKRKCAACNMCGIRFTHGEARPTVKHVLAHCVNGGLGHDHELFPHRSGCSGCSHPPTGHHHQNSSGYRSSISLLLRIRLRHLTMSGTCLDEKRLSAWMRRSWTSSGLNT